MCHHCLVISFSLHVKWHQCPLPRATGGVTETPYVEDPFGNEWICYHLYYFCLQVQLTRHECPFISTDTENFHLMRGHWIRAKQKALSGGLILPYLFCSSVVTEDFSSLTVSGNSRTQAHAGVRFLGCPLTGFKICAGPLRKSQP